ncbi:hypothetical protein T10_7618 [Trichinella papuae]|uniref:Uncharacterized protein n=1 Tax=Trichinella papuae TaxID=268474 RepID=A0A0V1MSN9_9BILA|nr:hypothetical protein T10_7618 [Trichinella papuae]
MVGYGKCFNAVGKALLGVLILPYRPAVDGDRSTILPANSNGKKLFHFENFWEALYLEIIECKVLCLFLFRFWTAYKNCPKVLNYCILIQIIHVLLSSRYQLLSLQLQFIE